MGNDGKSSDDSYVLQEDQPARIPANLGVLANDDDANNATLDREPRSGTVALADDGSFVYTPNRDYAGSDSFVYSAVTESGGSTSSTVTLTIEPINDAPYAGSAVGFTQPDTPISMSLTAQSADIEGDHFSIQSTGVPTHGSASLDGDLATYIPDPAFEGVDHFEFILTDEHGASSSATATVLTVAPYEASAPVELIEPEFGIRRGYFYWGGPWAQMSANGRFVLRSDFFRGVRLYDREISTDVAIADAGSVDASMSADAGLIAFSSEHGVVPDDFNGVADVFLHDRASDTTTIISRVPDGSPTDGASRTPRISADGSVIAFVTAATALLSDHLEGTYDLVAFDVGSGTMTRIASLPEGASEREPIVRYISADGRYVGTPTHLYDRMTGHAWNIADRYQSSGVELRGAVTPDAAVFAYASGPSLMTEDLRNDGDAINVVIAPDGVSKPSAVLEGAGISANGDFVVYQPTANNLVSGGSSYKDHVYVTDTRVPGRNARVSTAPGGYFANGFHRGALISHDGRWITFSMKSDNLIPGYESEEFDLVIARNPLISK